jgi:hypothetical protein
MSHSVCVAVTFAEDMPKLGSAQADERGGELARRAALLRGVQRAT